MKSPLFQQIENLTVQAGTYIAENKIELCNESLSHRQKLLEALKNEYDNCDGDNLQFTEHFVLLIKWIQQQDAPNMEMAERMKNLSKLKSLEQVKVSKALSQYKNFK
jgi:hypothetical protein